MEEWNVFMEKSVSLSQSIYQRIGIKQINFYVGLSK